VSKGIRLGYCEGSGPRAGIDSGQMLLVDPAYLLSRAQYQRLLELPRGSDGVTEINLADEIGVEDCGPFATAVLIESFGGDGYMTVDNHIAKERAREVGERRQQIVTVALAYAASGTYDNARLLLKAYYRRIPTRSPAKQMIAADGEIPADAKGGA